MQSYVRYIYDDNSPDSSYNKKCFRQKLYKKFKKIMFNNFFRKS
jgi:hypothetical protein